MSTQVTFHYARPDESYGSWRLVVPDSEPREADGESELGASWDVELPDDRHLRYRLENDEGQTDPPRRKSDKNDIVQEVAVPPGARHVLFPSGFIVQGQAAHLFPVPEEDGDDSDELEPRVTAMENAIQDFSQMLAAVQQLAQRAANGVDRAQEAADSARSAADRARQIADEARQIADGARLAAEGAQLFAAEAQQTAVGAQLTADRAGQEALDASGMAGRASAAAAQAGTAAGKAENLVQQLGRRLGFEPIEVTTTPAPGLLDTVQAAIDLLDPLDTSLRQVTSDFADRQRLRLEWQTPESGRLLTVTTPPAPEELTVQRLLALDALVRLKRREYQGILDDPSTSGGQTPERFAAVVNSVGAQARRQVREIANPTLASGLADDDRLRYELSSDAVLGNVNRLLTLTPPAAPPAALLAGPSPARAGALPSPTPAP